MRLMLNLCALMGSAVARLIEARAERIEDPVRRLRYLRRMMALPVVTGDFHAPAVGSWRVAALGLLVLLSLSWKWIPVTSGHATPAAQGVVIAKSVEPVSASRIASVQRVWLVDQQRQYELYSNGLRVERKYETNHFPRRYYLFPRSGKGNPVPATRPAGIIFHTTESSLAPFESIHNGTLRRFGANLLEYASGHHLYNYIVDRFGRVYRVVKDSDVANHAGYSAWADQEHVYVKLNQSFIGISFEGSSTNIASDPIINDAQVHSTKLLTQMLRAAYDIRAENCVTHAQVSVSPASWRIGYHTDWLAHFPFEQIGLPNNYSLPLPSVVLFGFGHEAEYLERADLSLSRSVLEGEEHLRRKALSASLPADRYRAGLRRQFSVLSEAMRQFTIAKETD